MDKKDSDSPHVRPHGQARLAALERLRNEAKQRNRQAMLDSIERLIEQEAKALRESQRTDAEPV